jgi:outer membrane protein assembly factor BamB
MRPRSAFSVLVISLIINTICSYGQPSWPQFRGPGGAGISFEKGSLPAELAPLKNLLWKCVVSEGVSSPCISDNKIFLTGRIGDSLETICINRISGNILWKRPVVPEKFERIHPVGHTAAPTPTTDGERVFSYFGSYGLICYDLNGNLIWEKRIPHQGNMYGTAVSPIIYGDKLIFSRDADANSYLEVINPKTGESIWRVERPEFRGNWSTPVIAKVNGLDQLIIYGIWWMKSYDLNNGAELWSFPGLTDEPIITPVYGDGLVFLTSYNMKTNPEVLGLPTWDSLLRMYDTDRDSMLLFEEIKSNKSILSRYDDDGDGNHPLPGFFRWLDVDRNGKITKKEWGKIVAWVDSFPHENALIALKPAEAQGLEPGVAWRYSFGVPECPSPLYYNGLVWMVADGGLITCLEAKTGKLVYSSKLDAGGAYYSSPVYGDGKIYVGSARGIVTIFEAGRELKVLSSNDFKERIMATPAISDGKVYVRTAGGLYAFGL